MGDGHMEDGIIENQPSTEQVEKDPNLDTQTKSTNMETEGNKNSNSPPFMEFMNQLRQFCQTPTSADGVGFRSSLPSDDKTLERFLNFHPPRFLGGPDDQKAESFIAEIEKIFDVLNYSDSQKIKYATYRLEDAARHWWLVVDRRWKQNLVQYTWSNFLKEFNSKFIPQVVYDAREQQFTNLIQGMNTVGQYEAQFSRLIQYAPRFWDDERRKFKKFVSGLRLEIRWAVIPVEFGSYVAAIDKALMVEAEIKELRRVGDKVKTSKSRNSGESSNKRPNQGHGPPKQGWTDNPPRHPPPNRPVVPTHQNNSQGCNFCGNPYHTEAKCWKRNGKCIACGSDQHLISGCPKRRNPTPQNTRP